MKIRSGNGRMLFRVVLAGDICPGGNGGKVETGKYAGVLAGVRDFELDFYEYRYKLNPRGCYLQALVWYAELFGRDPEKSTFVPDNISSEEIALLKKCAAEAVRNFPQVKAK